MIIKKIKYIIICLCVLLYFSRSSYAIGEIAVGLNAGATYDPNHLETSITQWNISNRVTALAINEIRIPYSFVWGYNIRYNFNYFLFRLGAHFTKTNDVSGRADFNKVSISSNYQFSAPVSICMSLPLKKHTYFYLGGGLTYHYASFQWAETLPSKKYRYADSISGFHYIIGAEAPVTQNITVSTEWIHQEGRSIPIKDSINKISTLTISVKGNFILFGVNYYIPI